MSGRLVPSVCACIWARGPCLTEWVYGTGMTPSVVALVPRSGLLVSSGCHHRDSSHLQEKGVGTGCPVLLQLGGGGGGAGRGVNEG